MGADGISRVGVLDRMAQRTERLRGVFIRVRMDGLQETLLGVIITGLAEKLFFGRGELLRRRDEEGGRLVLRIGWVHLGETLPKSIILLRGGADGNVNRPRMASLAYTAEWEMCRAPKGRRTQGDDR